MKLMTIDGMLLPPLCSQADYVRFAEGAGLKKFAAPFDISEKVSKTWYVDAYPSPVRLHADRLGTSHGRSFRTQLYGLSPFLRAEMDSLSCKLLGP